MDIISRDSAQTLAYDALFLACMHSSVPKFVTLLTFAVTAYQRDPVDATIYSLDALAIYGLLQLAQRPIRWTDTLIGGGASVWLGGRVIWGSETGQRWFNNYMRATFYSPPKKKSEEERTRKPLDAERSAEQAEL